jgi:hypothetical protein
MAASKLVPPLAWALLFAHSTCGGEIEHSALDDAPRITLTKSGIHGDPVNVALVGTKEQLIAAMVAAKWQPADPITFKSSTKLVKSVVLHRPDETAPVSNLYLWKRKEDLAFEQEVGRDASRRHHVRFWDSAKQVNGRPLWLGAATFDTKVGLSHKTGLPTHHIDANVDADRDKLLKDLTDWLSTTEGIEGFQSKHDGRNGGGDRYHTDEKLLLGILKNEGR